MPTIVTARISAVKAGLDVSVNELEAHYLAGGNVVRVVNALISADKANIDMPFKRAAAIDLAGRDVLQAVQMSVLPKVIETPRIAAVDSDTRGDPAWNSARSNRTCAWSASRAAVRHEARSVDAAPRRTR